MRSGTEGQSESTPAVVAVPRAPMPRWMRYGGWRGYAAAVALPLAAGLLVTFGIPWLGRTTPFAPMLIVVIGLGYLSGAGPAVVASVIGSVLVEALVLKRAGVDAGDRFGRVALFLSIGGLVSFISAHWRRAAMTAADREMKLRLLLDRMPVLLWSTDAALRLTSSSSAAVHYLFDKAAETLGLDASGAGEAFFQRDVAGFLPIAAQRRAVSGEAVSYELAAGERHFQVHVEPLRAANGDVSGTFGMAWDITEQYRAEGLAKQYQHDLEARVALRTDELAKANLVLMQQIAERKRAERELGEVSRHARCILWHGEVTLAEGDEGAVEEGGLVWNVRVSDEQSAQQILPLDVPHGEGYVRAFERSVHPQDEAETHRLARDAIARGSNGYSHEFRCTDRTGAEHWLLETVSVQRRGAGRCYLVGVCTDVTERKAAQSQREQLLLERAGRAEAEAASLAKDQFLAVLSHELRTPLTPVLLTISAMENDERLPEDVRSQVRVIRRNIELEARLIDDLLDLTRISRGKLELTLRDLDAHSLVMHARDVCLSDVQAKRLKLELRANAERCFVRGDGTRLQQVFWNLIRNAVKFTPEGGTITVTTANDAEGRLVVSVSDTGVGIEPEVLPRIFEAFEQGGRETTRRFGGLGLGLAISKALVEMQHGTLGAASAGRNRGATFTVRMATVDAVMPEPASARPAHGADVAQQLRILLVEDHGDTRRATARLLRLMGHDVATADCVAAALRAAESRLEQMEHNAATDRTAACPFDLIVSDIGLPDGNGLDLMRQLKARFRVKGIALSGFGMDSDIENSKAAGFDLHLTKPVALDQLEAAIRQVAEAVGA